MTTNDTAASPDGRTFTLGAGYVTAVPGDLLVLQVEDGTEFLGQVLSVALPGAGPSGMVLGAIEAGAQPRRDARRPFSSASVRAAEADTLTDLQRTTGTTLPVGTWASHGVEIPALLRAQGFGRHTFLCGQSGSGKTYALGVILEQLLLGTRLRMVVLDPNADFVRLGEPRPSAPAESARELNELDVQILGGGPTATAPLRARFQTMPRSAQAAVLRLDPIVDRGEYNFFVKRITSGAQAAGVRQIVDFLLKGDTDERSLGQRIENLGLAESELWAYDQPSAADVVAGGARATVLDLNGFDDPHEPQIAALEVLEALWTQRESRTPTLIVIDEAHNLCPATPNGPLEHALVERISRIAAEGRKYGLWLLLSTQRPSKIHPQVLSQCDNLVLMRMNSPADLAELADAFGFAPAAMLRSSQSFVQGEALVAGGFVPVPALIRMGARLTPEGGTDVSVPMP